MMQGLRRCGSTLGLLVNECVAAVAASLLGWLALGAGLSWQQSVCVALVLAGVVIGMTPGPIPRLPRPVLWRGCAFAAAGGLFQAVSANLSKHGFELVKAAGASPLPAQAAYQRLLGGCTVALVVLLVTRAMRGGRQESAAAPFPDSPLPAAAWVGLNALLGPVLGVTCMLWAISLVKNPGLVQTVAATATLLSVPLAWRLEGARPRAPYFAGCALALCGVAGLYLAK
jgi:drug/metabolite transporter (DMT)-like permease